MNINFILQNNFNSLRYLHLDHIMAEQDSKVESKVQSDSDEDGNEVLEESPCGRWQKRKEKVIDLIIY